MTRHIFDWHPELNLFANNLRNKVEILLPDGEGNHFPPPQEQCYRKSIYLFYESKQSPRSEIYFLPMCWGIGSE